jgi:hypothetical protein
MLVETFFEFYNSKDRKMYCRNNGIPFESFLLSLKVYKQLCGILGEREDNGGNIGDVYRPIIRSLFINLCRRVNNFRNYSKILYGNKNDLFTSKDAGSDYLIYYGLKGGAKVMCCTMVVDEQDVSEIKRFFRLTVDS